MSEEQPESLEVTTAFAVVMGLDGSVAVVADLPLRALRAPSHTDIQMMCGFVYDSLAHPKLHTDKADPMDAVQAALQKRMEEKGE